MCLQGLLCSHLILVLALLVNQMQSTFGISLAKKLTQTIEYNGLQAEKIDKIIEKSPYKHLLEDMQTKIIKRNSRKAPLKKKPRKTSRKDNPFLGTNCNEDHVLDYGEATVVFSDDGSQAQRCRSTFSSPEGTTLQMDCPLFNLAGDGCRKERLLVNEKYKKKKNFCEGETPDRYKSTSNNMAIIYRRHEWKQGEFKSPGFICKVMVIGDRPTTTPSTTPTTTPSTIYTWTSSTPTTTPTTQRSTRSTWWPPGTYWTDQTWSDGSNAGWWSFNPFTSTTTTTLSPASGASNTTQATTWIFIPNLLQQQP